MNPFTKESIDEKHKSKSHQELLARCVKTRMLLEAITGMEPHERIPALVSILPDILTDEEAVFLGNHLGRVPHDRLRRE